MIINVRVQPNASKNKVEQISAIDFKVYTCKPAVEGNANKATIQMIADYMKVKKAKIFIKSGLKSRNKIVQINN